MPDGGVVAIRGFVYQFDRTILEVVGNPDRMVHVERIEDFNTEDWCVQVKHRTSRFSPSALADAIVGLWRVHLVQPDLALRVHCHFPDKTPNTTIRYSADDILKHWGTKLHWVAGEGTASIAPRHLIQVFAERLEVQFTEDLESQFRTVVERIRDTFPSTDGKKIDREEAITCHAQIRAHLMGVAANPDPTQRKVSLSELREVVSKARRVIFGLAYAEFIGRDRYLREIARRFRKLRTDGRWAFIIDVGPLAPIPELVTSALAMIELATRSGRSKQPGLRLPPILCVRGLSDTDYEQFLGRIYANLRTGIGGATVSELPFVDGYPYLGSEFHSDLLFDKGWLNHYRFALLHPADLGSPDMLPRLSANVPFIYRFRCSDAPFSLGDLTQARHFDVPDTSALVDVFSPLVG